MFAETEGDIIFLSKFIVSHVIGESNYYKLLTSFHKFATILLLSLSIKPNQFY